MSNKWVKKATVKANNLWKLTTKSFIRVSKFCLGQINLFRIVVDKKLKKKMLVKRRMKKILKKKKN